MSVRCLLCVVLLSPIVLSAQVRQNAGPAGANPAIPTCKASDLSLGTDDENGSFNGMSQSGTLLVLRNLSPTPCRVPQQPEIHFVNGTKPLDVKLEIPGARFMHPGPVLVPVVIASEAEVTSKLHWVSGEVYDDNVCVTPTAITITIGGEVQQAQLSAHLCGGKAKGITFQATSLVADPTYKGR